MAVLPANPSRGTIEAVLALSTVMHAAAQAAQPKPSSSEADARTSGSSAAAAFARLRGGELGGSHAPHTPVPAAAAAAAAPVEVAGAAPRHLLVRHDKARRIVTIEVSETAVMAFYMSGCAFIIGGVALGCALWQRTRGGAPKQEPCECHWCQGRIKERRSLGKGGFGEASLALRHGKTIVLKKIGCASVNDANQALLEASCLQRLSHPGVVRFEDVFLHRHEAGGVSVCVAMEYCAGGDLIDRMACRRGELPLLEAQLVSFLSTLCRTLYYVHSCGVLHRDLKSTNIFVTRGDATVKLGDFGLARAGLSRRRLSGSPRRHSRCGTDLYMSPEVEARKPYGAASDVYGLGCVLLEMLLQSQLRERRLAETRRESIAAALGTARRRHSWDTLDELSALAWRMLDESPKTRIDLPRAAAVADKCLALLRPAERATVGGASASAAATLPARAASDSRLAVCPRGGGARLDVARGGRAVCTAEAAADGLGPPTPTDSEPTLDGGATTSTTSADSAARAKKPKPARPPRRRRLRYAE